MRTCFLPFLLLGALGSVMAASPVRAALPACISLQEQQAMAIRSFQSSLMVAAVGCNQAQAYNTFATRYRSELGATGPVLRSYFQRVYGRGSETKLNDFITDLANAWSRRHMADKQTYCQEAWDTMWYLTAGPQAGRELFAQAVALRARAPESVAVVCAAPTSTPATKAPPAPVPVSPPAAARAR